RLLSEGNDEGLDALADELRQRLDDRHLRLIHNGYGTEPKPGQSEAERFDALVAHVATLGVFAGEPAAREALENLGTCETAGILVRNLVLQIVDGDKQHRRADGRIGIDGTGN